MQNISDSQRCAIIIRNLANESRSFPSFSDACRVVVEMIDDKNEIQRLIDFIRVQFMRSANSYNFIADIMKEHAKHVGFDNSEALVESARRACFAINRRLSA